MTTQGTETRQGQDLQGLGAKHDGPFGAADAPQTTNNAETIMTDVQQAVPVAQELGGFTLGMNVRIRDGVPHFGGLTGYVEKIYEPSPSQYPIEVMLTERKDSRCFRPHELEVIALPCKSGEGAFPDIGSDPMKGDRADRIEQSVAACREAYVKQQKGVPDQTALVWRWHLGALLECATRLKAILARTDATQTREAELLAALTEARETFQQIAAALREHDAEGLAQVIAVAELTETGCVAALNARGGA